MQPRDHMSTASLYAASFARISGAMKLGVPQIVMFSSLEKQTTAS